MKDICGSFTYLTNFWSLFYSFIYFIAACSTTATCSTHQKTGVLVFMPQGSVLACLFSCVFCGFVGLSTWSASMVYYLIHRVKALTRAWNKVWMDSLYRNNRNIVHVGQMRISMLEGFEFKASPFTVFLICYISHYFTVAHWGSEGSAPETEGISWKHTVQL